MHAIIRQGDGRYYTSVVLACYDDSPNEHGYGRYFIVLNEEKNKIIKQLMYNPAKKPYIDTIVLLIDDKQTDWNVDNDGYGCVNLFTKSALLEYSQGKDIPDDLLEKCKNLDSCYNYKEYNTIDNQEDIERFMLVSGCFHDASIQETELLEDETLRVLFEGLWGCSIEMFFSGNVSYCTESRNPKLYDPYWFGASIIIDNGMIIFVDEEDVELEDINDNYCWFKAEKLVYRVIPE